MPEVNFSKYNYLGESKILLRTKGEKTDYPIGSYRSFIMENDGIKTTKSCKIEKLIKTDQDSDSNFYSWYIVSEYEESTDDSIRRDNQIEKTQSTLDYLLIINGQKLPDENIPKELQDENTRKGGESKFFNLIKDYYNKGYWSEEWVRTAGKEQLTSEEINSILGIEPDKK